MPEVCSSRSSILMGRRSGTRSSTGRPEASFLSTPSFMPAKEGMYLLTGSSSAIFPRSTSIIAATLVMVLVTEWIGKIASTVIGVAFSTSRLPKHLKYTGWPWCWIRTMAPGMLPAAISALRKSSMAESFSRDSTACGGGPSWAAETVATVAANKAAQRLDDAKCRGNMLDPAVMRTGASEVIALLQSDPDGRDEAVGGCFKSSLLASNHQEKPFRHPAMLALGVMQHMKMPIRNLQRHLVKQACLYARHRHGSGNCRGAHAGFHG